MAFGGRILLACMAGLLFVATAAVPVLAQTEGTIPESDSDHTTEESLLRASNAEQRDVFGWAVSVDGTRAIVGAQNEAGPSNRTIRGGAAYIFERAEDDWSETTILRAPDAAWGDRFGHAVDIDGDWAVVGAYLDDGPSDGAYNAGAAYLFRRSDQGTWAHVTTLRPSDLASGDRFGSSVAIDGDRVLVGAQRENGPSGNARAAGAAYVFTRSGEKTWEEEQVLRASNPDAQDAFGVSVALDGTQALIGAVGDAGPSNAQTDAGAAYLFERSEEGTWTQAQLLRASNAEEGDLFGWSVALEGRHAVVGVHREDGPNNELRRAGAVYVYERIGDTWPAQETALIRSPNIETNDEFGYAVDIDRERLLIGAVSEDGPSAGPMNAGTAYLFENTAQGWSAADGMPFRASNAGRGDLFGRSVALDGPWMIAGTLSEDGPSDEMSQSGAAYFFKRTAPPTVALGDASKGEGSEIVIEGTVGPGGTETTVNVEYREVGTESFLSAIADPSSVSGVGETTVGGRLDDLTPGTDYEVRLVAANTVGGDTSTTASVVLPPVEPVAMHRRTVYGTDAPTDGGWRMLAQPAAGATRASLEDDLDFERYSTPILYRWDGTQWSAQEQSGDPLPRGEGFIVYLSDDASNPLDTEGRTLDVPQGPEDPTADVTIDGLAQETSVHLLGNPYGTAFSLDSLANGNLPAAGFQAIVQVWNPNTKQFEQIVQGEADAHVPAWQGFFLQRTTVGRGETSVTFAAGGQQSGPGALIGSKSPPKMVAARSASDKRSSRTKEVSIQLDVADADGDTVGTDRATLWMDERARDGYDGYEAQDLPPPGTDSYVTATFPIEHRGQVVQRAQAARPFTPVGVIDYQIPLSVRGIQAEGTATLSWPQSLQAQLPEGWTVTLLDTNTGETTDLRDAAYSFKLEQGGKAASPESARFQVRVKSGARPVEVATFEGASVQDGVQLRWTAPSVPNREGFRVLRQVDGTGTWAEVGAVKSSTRKSTSGKSHTYEYTDGDLPYAADSVSYRLKQMDAQGETYMSKSVAVNMTAKMELLGTYPNPARERATVRFSVPSGHQDDDVRLRMYDVLGRQVRTVAAGSITGRQKHQLDVSDLSSGVYILQLKAGSQTKTQRLTVVR